MVSNENVERQTSAFAVHRKLAAGRSVAALVVVAALLSPGRADACTCLPADPPSQAGWQHSDVFVARVVDTSAMPDLVRRVAAALGGWAPAWLTQRRVRVQVTEIFRGSRHAGEANLFTAVSETACGVEFVPGETYLVYGDDVDSVLLTDLCSRTRVLRQAADDLAYWRQQFR